MLSDDRKPKRIRDPVHGLIVFGEGKSDFQDETDRIAWELLNTPEFQRLRRINQLGFSPLIYPGATHSRFSHSVGTYYLARRLIDLINRRIIQGRIRDDIPVDLGEHRQRVALLAALLHDIGHGPFSHAFEDVVRDAHRRREVKRKKERPKDETEPPPRSHEQWSAEIVTSADTDVYKVLEKSPSVGNQPPLYDEIANLLKSEHPKDIYGTVVSSQFDADRLDYMQRDRLMTGVQSAHIDLDWILDCLEVGAVTDKGSDSADDFILLPCFYLNDKGIESAVEYLRARKELYRMVYYHKTTRSAEVMLRELLNRATNTFDRISKVDPKALNDGDKRLLNDPVLRYLSSESPPISTYLELDDDAVSSTVVALTRSFHRDLSCLAKRLRTRQLYKRVDVQIPEISLRRQLKEGHERGDELCVGLNNRDVLFDLAQSAFYHGDVNEQSATELLKRILVQPDRPNDDPVDIVSKRKELESEAGVNFQRAYVPDRELQCKLKKFLGKPK